MRREQEDLRRQFETELARRKVQGEDKGGVVPDRTPPQTPMTRHRAAQAAAAQGALAEESDDGHLMEAQHKHHHEPPPVESFYGHNDHGHHHHHERQSSVAPEAPGRGGAVDDILAAHAPRGGGGAVRRSFEVRRSVESARGDEYGYVQSKGAALQAEPSPVHTERGRGNKENSAPQGGRGALAVPRNRMPLSKALAATGRAVGGHREAPPPPVFATKGVPSASEQRAIAKLGRQQAGQQEQVLRRGGAGSFQRGRSVQAQSGRGEAQFGRRAVVAQPEGRGGRGEAMQQSLEGDSLFLTPRHSLAALFSTRNATTGSPGSRHALRAMGHRPDTTHGMETPREDEVFYSGARLGRATEHVAKELHELKFPLAPEERRRLDGLLQAFVMADV